MKLFAKNKNTSLLIEILRIFAENFNHKLNSSL